MNIATWAMIHGYGVDWAWSNIASLKPSPSRRGTTPEIPEDQVAAYDRIAAVFAAISEQRRAYLNGVEKVVIAGIPAGSRSLLDIGSGDGARSRRIAQARGIVKVVQIEPSEAMQRNGPPESDVRIMRAEDLRLLKPEFDVILCLWNVLGHIFPGASRAEVLRQCKRLLSPQGRMFLDVSHRYNARHYGVLPTTLRFLRDLLSWHETNGDVTVHWNVSGVQASTLGHVFTDREIKSLCRLAGLRIDRKLVVDYVTGELPRWPFQGHLTYILGR